MQDTILNIVGSVMYIAAGSLAIEYHNTPGVENFYQLTGVRDNTTVSLKPSQKFRKEETNFLTELSSLIISTGACCIEKGGGWVGWGGGGYTSAFNNRIEFSVHNYNDDFSDGPPTVIWIL